MWAKVHQKEVLALPVRLTFVGKQIMQMLHDSPRGNHLGFVFLLFNLRIILKKSHSQKSTCS